MMCVGRVRARAKEIDLEAQVKVKLDAAHLFYTLFENLVIVSYTIISAKVLQEKSIKS
uniref:Uncharacterized protein n=1 Tax=Parascaris equorum TaxID=6256 RepID=A0A914RNW7_PAREQ